MNYTVTELLFYWIFPIIAVTHVIVYSNLLEPLRKHLSRFGKIGYLIQCGICVGAYVGIIIGFANGKEYWPEWLQKPALGLCAGIAIFVLIELLMKEEE